MTVKTFTMVDILSEVTGTKRYYLMTIVFVFYSTIIILIVRHQIIDSSAIPEVIDNDIVIDNGPSINISEIIWTVTSLGTSGGDDSTTNTYYDPGVDANYSLSLVKKKRWSISKWDARCLTTRLTLPVVTVYVAESQTPNCLRYLDCLAFVSELLDHDSSPYGDIQYNFVVTGQGSIFEGLSWDCKVHNVTVGTDAILVLMTGYSKQRDYYVTTQQYDSLKVFLQYSVMTQKLSPAYSLKPFCCIVAGNNPGKILYWGLAARYNKEFYFYCNNHYNCTNT